MTPAKFMFVTRTIAILLGILIFKFGKLLFAPEYSSEFLGGLPNIDPPACRSDQIVIGRKIPLHIGLHRAVLLPLDDLVRAPRRSDPKLTGDVLRGRFTLGA